MTNLRRTKYEVPIKRTDPNLDLEPDPSFFIQVRIKIRIRHTGGEDDWDVLRVWHSSIVCQKCLVGTLSNNSKNINKIKVDNKSKLLTKSPNLNMKRVLSQPILGKHETFLFDYRTLSSEQQNSWLLLKLKYCVQAKQEEEESFFVYWFWWHKPK